MVYCQNCGGENVEDARFCVHCGSHIKRAGEATGREEPLRRPVEAPEREAPGERKPAPKGERGSRGPLSPPVVVGIMVIVAVACFVAGLLLADHLGGNGGNGEQGPVVDMTVQEFYQALSYSIDEENLTIFSSIQGAEAGDTLRVTGEVVRVVGNSDSQIGEYTSLALYNTNETNLLVHVLGNLTQEYGAGEGVEVTLHVVYRQDQYPGLYGETWSLLGEFLEEEFLDGRFALDLILPPSQVKKV